MKNAILLLILFSLFSNGYAQDVKIDSITGVITSELPFDRQFFLPIKHEKNRKINYLKVTKYRKGLESDFHIKDKKRAEEVYGADRVSLTKDEGGNQHTMLINLSDEKVFKIKKSEIVFKSKKERFILVFPLAPSTGYRFGVGISDLSYNPERRDAIKKAFDDLSDSKPIETDTVKINESIANAFAKKKYNEVIKLAIYKDDLVQKNSSLDDFHKSVEEILEKEKSNVPVNLDGFSDCYSEIFQFLSDCDSCSVYNRLVKKELEENNPLLLFDTAFIERIEEGYLNIKESNLSKSIKEYDYTNRIKNLQITYKVLVRYLGLQFYSTDVNCFDNNLLTEIKTKIDYLTAIKSAWTKVIENCTQYELVLSLDLFSLTSFYGFSGGSTTLESKGKFVVRPNLGISLATDGEFARVLPSIGVRFNFRPLDPNLPYRHIMKKGFGHRSSMGITFSTNSISDGTTRFDLIGKSNLLLDYGFRLNNALSLNFGALVFKREDPRPFVTGQKLAALPLIGISIDFQILEAINDIKNVLTGK